MTISTFFPQAGSGGGNVTTDGQVSRGGQNQTLAAIIAGAGTEHFELSTSQGPTLISTSTTNQYAQLTRVIFTFDTSSIGSDDISDSTISFFGQSKQNAFGGMAMTLVSANPASDNILVNSDYGTLGSTELATRIAFASYSVSAYNDFSLNASGISNINKTGISGFGQRSSFDFDGSGASWGSGLVAFVNSFHADEVGTTKDPKLVVTHAPPGLAFASLNGVLTSNIASINGVAIGDMASINAQV